MSQQQSNMKKNLSHLSIFLKKKKWNNIQSEFIQHMAQKALQLREQQSAWQHFSILTATITTDGIKKASQYSIRYIILIL